MAESSSGVEISQETVGADHILRLRGELDIAGVPSLEALVATVCAQDAASVTIDLGELSFIDSTGLAAIVHISGLCDRQGKRFELRPGPRAVQRVFEVTGLDGVLPFVGN